MSFSSLVYVYRKGNQTQGLANAKCLEVFALPLSYNQSLPPPAPPFFFFLQYLELNPEPWDMLGKALSSKKLFSMLLLHTATTSSWLASQSS
jgi:hypothetical protein